MSQPVGSQSKNRRAFLAYFSSVGLSATLLPGVLWSRLQEGRAGRVTVEDLGQAAKVAGLELSEEEKKEMVQGVNNNLARYESLRKVPLDNSVPLPMYFNPRVPGITLERGKKIFLPTKMPSVKRPANLEDVAFWPVGRLAGLIRTRQVKSVELTEMYLARLKKFNPVLNCVVTLTEELAMSQAKQADLDLAAGRYHGPLHGIPWGAKDIIAAKGYRTTWGAAAFQDQIIDRNATVVERLAKAGAVLIAKLTTGELAFGDQWFGGRTNNPWDPTEGSSGSSAGSGAATAAGLVGFAIGTDTGGSLVSPSERCGIVGLRPTFGRVSRFGIMAAGFTLDKVGPMCRAVEDCALVLDAIAGPDGLDLSVPEDVPFSWDAGWDFRKLRVGYAKSEFDAERQADYRRNNEATLNTLRSLGLDLRPVILPESDLNFFIEYSERACGFDEFIRSRKDGGMRWKGHRAVLEVAHLVPAADYLQANRVRMLLMQEMARVFSDVDVIVAPRPSLDPRRSLNPITSLTGHPVLSLPNGFSAKGTPTGITIAGQIYGEDRILSLAKALEAATEFHLKHPALA
jgi:Asp-tRNA(Asn)/Glu-tRNA(Gln) amidotransferase A subunit family amidase